MAGLRHKIGMELEETDDRPSLGRLFTQDFSRIEDEQLESAARERIRALDHVPAFLLGVHLICAAAFLLGLGNPADPDPALLAPLGALILLDFGVWAWLWRNPLSGLSPHVAVRAAALYCFVAYVLWCAASVAAAPNHAQNLTLLDLAVAYLDHPDFPERYRPRADAVDGEGEGEG